MEKIKGICKNYTLCDKADNEEVQEIEKSAPFVCEECGKPLTVEKVPPPPPWIIYAIVAALILGGVAYWFFLRDKTPPPIGVSEVSLNATSQEKQIGETFELIATVLPDDAADKTVTWASSNDAIATVADGIVTTVADGSASITVTTVEGAKTATCAVTVIKPEEPPIDKGRDTVIVIITDTITEVIEVPVVTEPSEPPPPPPSGKRYPFGNYVGGMKDGRPHGEGQMQYTRQVRIAKHDINNKYCAEVGDIFYGSWWNGDIEQGDLKDSHNNPKATLRPGRRPNPYDITNDESCR